MFNLHITLADAVAAMRDIAFRYPTRTGTGDHGCAYVQVTVGHRLVPSCIIGQYFDDLGILRVLVGTEDRYDAGGYCGLRFEDSNGEGRYNLGALSGQRNTLASKWDITFTDDAFEFLTAAQSSQDNGAEWAQAVLDAANTVLAKKNVTTDPLDLLLSVGDKDEAEDPEDDGLADWERELLNG